MSNAKVPIKGLVGLKRLQSLSVQNGDGWVEVMLPLITVSEANGGNKTTRTIAGKTFFKSEHWTDKHKRHKQQKAMVAMTLRRFKKVLRLPCLITLTRYGSKKLDKFDNLPMSLKWILDAICEILTGDYRPGRADDTDEIDVKYLQEITNIYGVKIRIEY